MDNMYANIPRQEAITSPEKQLEKSEKVLKEETIDIIKIIRMVIIKSYFTYNSTIHYEPSGLPMGGTLSATLAEICIKVYEKFTY